MGDRRKGNIDPLFDPHDNAARDPLNTVYDSNSQTVYI